MATFQHITCFVISVLLLYPLTTTSLYQHVETMSENWLNHGGDIYNRRYANKEHKISLETVGNLSLKWKFFAGRDITATPAILNGILYFPSWNGNIYAVRAMSGTYYRGAYYVGSSSLEELLSTEECCTFRGSFSKLDIKSGSIIWQTFMLPDNKGKKGEYAGGVVLQLIPQETIFTLQLEIYTLPLYTYENVKRKRTIKVDQHILMSVLNPKIFLIQSLHLIWIMVKLNGPNPDADFGEAPMVLTIDVNGTKEDVVVAVQKSGFAWALNRDNGNIIWSTEAGPGGVAGGGTWGAATDEERIYTNIVNSEGKNFTLKPSNETITSGGWVAMEAKSGKILWSIANPSNASANGPVSVANGIVFAGSADGKGPIYAINGKNGEIVWSYETGSTVYGGMSISDGCIYLGNGYSINLAVFLRNTTAGTSLYAFCV